MPKDPDKVSIIKRIGKSGFSTLLIIATWGSTFLGWLPQEYAESARRAPIDAPWAFVFWGLILTILLLRFAIAGVNSLRYALGGKAGPIGRRRLVHFLNPYAFFLTIARIREFERIASKFLEPKTIMDSATFHTVLARSLRKARQCISVAVGCEVSLNVKLFKGSGSNEEDTSDALLYTYERAPSPLELEERMDLEEFKIVYGPKGVGESLIANPPSDDDAKQNSAYNYCFGKCSHYFVSNDLPALARKKEYFSNSNNYQKFYRSLAVFVMSAPAWEGNETELTRDSPERPIGIFVVDSFEKNRLDSAVFLYLAGYFNQRLFAIFDTYKKAIEATSEKLETADEHP